MKKLIQATLIICAVFISSNSFAAEQISDYSVEITLNQDSSMDVVETINYDFGGYHRHGIFRFIPVHFDVDGQKKLFGLLTRKLTFDNIQVLRDGQPEPFTTEKKDSNGNYFLKIGNANETITGLHTYTISYRVHGSLRYFENYDEIYWNAIGLDWQVPIERADITITSDAVRFNESSCYVGALESNKPCSFSQFDGNQSLVFSHQNLQAYEGLTVAASFDKGLVEKKELVGLSLFGILGSIATSLVALGGFIHLMIRKYQRKYFVHDPIHARYSPPENLHPLLVGKMVDKTIHPRDISAGIIQLAIDGYITIEKTEKKGFLGSSDDYIFTLKKETAENDAGINTILKDILFGDIFKLNPTEIREKKMSDISPNFISVYIRKLRNQVNTFLFDNDYLEKRGMSGNWIILIPFLFAFGFFAVQMVIPGIVSFFATFFVGIFMGMIDSRYTQKGWRTKHAIEGFKRFLEMTEKERYTFHNAPEKNPQEFMHYLPYAIALGVEKQWAEQFKNITIEQPDWYKGDSLFVASHFVDDMSAFTQSVSSKSATRSSSSSGSSGGGFSGGGSGGGGGGSW